ncbi:MAG TPA: HEAT repeat domain-containing protein, partial [Longimicrobiales bacterium]|nr:HEAT repeat domain-containing protein [Longimicrobiales bacterium]
MKTPARCALAALLCAGVFSINVVAAQTLASRVDAAAPGHVRFSFAARPGVCGNGRDFIQTQPGSYSGSFSTESLRLEPCEPGPVHVLLDRANREVISVRTYVGPATALPAATDLGRVPPQQAADYLLQLAARTEGRVGRDAILPASLADSATILEGLIAVARNQALPRETRGSALSHVGRASERTPTVPAAAIETLVFIARDEADNLSVRKQALSVLGRLEHGAGTQPLMELAQQNASLWLVREAMTVLAASGDPRARTYLRSAVQRTDLPEDVLSAAIRALGQRYSTQQDATLLRSLYPRLHSDRTRDAVLTAVADVGGGDNVKWLVDVVRDENEALTNRRRALENAARAGAPIND